MVAVGVGGADAVDVMTGFPFKRPLAQADRRPPDRGAERLVLPQGRHPEGGGDPHGQGGTGAIVEYFGPGAESISCTGKATICNMGAEIGATTSVFGYDDAMSRYLKATGREEIASARTPWPATSGRTTRSWPTPTATTTNWSSSTCPPWSPTSTAPHAGPGPSGGGAGRRGRRTTGHSRSPPRSSAPARTPPTRTSHAPRPSCATPRRTGSR